MAGDWVDDARERLRDSTSDANVIAGGSVAWDPTGARFASIHLGTIHLWATNDLSRPTSSLRVADQPLIRLAWSGDGSRLAVSCSDGRVRAYLVHTDLEPILDVQAASDWVTDVTWSRAGDRLVLVDRFGTIQVWDADSKRRIEQAQTQGPMRTVDWGPDDHIVTGGDRGIAEIWSEDLFRVEAHDLESGYIWSAAWHPFTSAIAYATSHGRVIIDDRPTSAESTGLETVRGAVWDAGWSPDGSTLAAVGDDGLLRIRTTTDPSEPWTAIPASDRPLTALSWNPEGGIVATAGDDGVVRFWDATVRFWNSGPSTDAPRPPSSSDPPPAPPPQVDEAPIETPPEPPTDPDAAELPGSYREPAPSEMIWALAWHRGGGQIVAGRENGRIELWDLEEDGSRRLRADVTRGSRVWSVAFEPNGERVASGHGNGTVDLWDGQDLHVRGSVVTTPERSAVQSVAWDPNAPRLIVGGTDGHLRSWSIASGQIDRDETIGAGQLRQVAWRPDGEELATVGEDGQLRIWSADLTTRLGEVAASDRWVWAVAWSPDGTRLATGVGEDGTIAIWDRASMAVVAQVVQTGRLRSLDWSPTGEHLASTTGDGRLCVWAVDDLSPVDDQQLSDGPLRVVRWSPDGSRLAAAGADGQIHLVAAPRSSGGLFSALTRRWVAAAPPIAEQPARTDTLQRSPITNHLVRQMTELATAAEGADVPTFALHIDGAWGAGKSSVANFIASRLTNESFEPAHDDIGEVPRADDHPPWTVVSINAWRATQGAPWWWSLAAELRAGLAGQRPGGERVAFRIADIGSRLLRAGGLLVAAAIVGTVALAVAAAALVLHWKLKIPNIAVGSAAFVAAASLLTALNRFILWDSPAGARLHERADRSPMDDVCAHLAWLRRWSPRFPPSSAGAGPRIGATCSLVLGLAISAAIAFAISVDDASADADRRHALIVMAGLAIVVVTCRFVVSIPPRRGALPREVAEPTYRPFLEHAVRIPRPLDRAVTTAVAAGLVATGLGWWWEQVGHVRVFWWLPGVVAATVGAGAGLVLGRAPQPDARTRPDLAGALLLGALAALPVAVAFWLPDPEAKRPRWWAPTEWTWGLALVILTVVVIGASWTIVLAWLARRRAPAKRPILVVVDEVDRCQAKQVVELLEAIQTVARSSVGPRRGSRQAAPLGFLLLADGQWIRTAFEEGYKEFQASRSTLLDPLGARFLQKLFELSIRIPDLSPHQTNAHLAEVLGLPAPDADADGSRRSDEPAGATVPVGEPDRGEVMDEPGPAEPDEAGEPIGIPPPTPDPADTDRREDSVMTPTQGATGGGPRTAVTEASIAVQNVEVVNMLAPYAAFLEPNPRSLRRTAAAFLAQRAVHRTLGVLDLEVDDERDLLVRWTILATRWPALADRIADPSAPNEDALRDDAELRFALGHHEVAAVLGYQPQQDEVIDDLDPTFEANRRSTPLTVHDLRTAAGARPLAGSSART